ncbi:MAG: hypothetical protein COB36_03925 [Alphaproteobacteria bacterium]|nr:MAG: hypothetical protein COB36_03925 [Alphaproteobacteria bacterium]
MDKKIPSLLGKDINQAMHGAQTSASSDMKYCAIMNVGMVPLHKDDRAQIFVSNSQLVSTIGLVHFTESGLNNNDFATVVADVIEPHLLMGKVADIELFCEGCFSLRIAPEALADFHMNFSPERLAFVSYDTRGEVANIMQNYKLKSSSPNFPKERPYLDA